MNVKKQLFLSRLCENFVVCICNTWIHITRFVKLPNSNRNTMLKLLRYNDASVAVFKAGKTSVHFVEKRTKVDASYYRETLLQRCLLPEIRQNSEVWRSFRVSAGRRAVASSEVDRRIPAAYRAELN